MVSVINSVMKIPKKNNPRSKRGRYADFKWIINHSFIKTLPEERFEHWGYLVYSKLNSKLISMALVSNVIEN